MLEIIFNLYFAGMLAMIFLLMTGLITLVNVDDREKIEATLKDYIILVLLYPIILVNLLLEYFNK